MNKREFSSRIVADIKEQIQNLTNPINVLTMAVIDFGKPIICCNANCFYPTPDSTWLAFELYFDPKADIKGGLMVVEYSTIDFSMAVCPIEMYTHTRFSYKTLAEKNAVIEKFVTHFMNAMNIDYFQMRREMTAELYKTLIADMPKEVGCEVFDDYDIQHLIEDCRSFCPDET